jgi:cytochrome c553
MSEGFVNGTTLVAIMVTTFGVVWITYAAAQSPPHQPDIAHGAVIAAQGLSAGVPACAQCHAFNGSSDGSGAFPRIAGQSTYYLSKELRDFATGVRRNAIMTPIAKALTPEDSADVAAYFAGMNSAFPPLANVDPALFKRGQQLAKVGDEVKGIQSCNNCHGPSGVGELPAIPYLSGQYAHYIALQLRMWQRGFRKNNPEAMEDIAKRLDDEDIAAVAAYFQQVRTSDLSAAQSGK